MNTTQAAALLDSVADVIVALHDGEHHPLESDPRTGETRPLDWWVGKYAVGWRSLTDAQRDGRIASRDERY